MGPHNWVRAVIHCTRHHQDCPPLCVRVEAEVPEPLRCSPGGGSPGGGSAGVGGTSPDCPCGGRFDWSDLGRRVADALRRGRGEWVRRGAVVIEV